MKKIVNLSLISLLFVSVMTTSCSDDDNKTIATDAAAPVLISPQDATAIVLDPDLQSNPALTLVWNHGDYTAPTEINYNIEMAVAGTDFATVISAGTTTNRVFTMTVAELNGKALEAGLTPYELGSLDVRIAASLGTNNAMPMTSNSIKIDITPYTTESPKLYLRGNFTAASGYGPNWGDNTTPPFIQAAAYGETAFEGYIYFNDAAPEVKFIPNAVDFTGDYADADASGTSGILAQEGETNIKVPAAGYYRVEADTDALTYKLTATEWGVIGNATPGGWDNSTPMTYNAETKKWTITVALTAQAAPDNGWKFRANNAWDINMGDVTVNSTSGELSYGGQNIGVAEAGTYVITLDLSNPRAYTYTIVKQ
ncbi:SusE domain-containing protein [Flavobacterium sp. DG1-102-2]|uniref:SusE domain-containing protein n=1 Tax=Flavobacterium sp. DG1-102-2 TaxID=3081663 RepID=UPI002948E03F|nr:SusE domain-containing protein [Flavobacterium sp. DG1-102-2]MDV6169024.1 SusE domain-containing protein [Flavobacterium sp. DG1-102-2]